MHVLITGAGGTIGRALTRALIERGDAVTGVSRTPARQKASEVAWIGWDGVEEAVARADAVVHLAGAGVADHRWTANYKAKLRASRIDTARRLSAAIAAAATKPKVFVSASAVGYYGDRGNDALTESAPAGTDFLATLCRDWEAAAQGGGVRTVLLRSGVVLARDGGALPRMRFPFKLGLGGSIGRGRQWFPWVHIDDVVGVILHVIKTETISGPINVAAPTSVTNADFSRALGRALHRPVFLRVPPAIFRLQLGEGAGALTSSQRVLSTRIEASGYPFRFPTIEAALADLAG